MACRTKRLWADEEKRPIGFQTTGPDISVAQVARRYATNANLIVKWPRDPRFAPEPGAAPKAEPCFLPIEIMDYISGEERPPTGGAPKVGGTIEIDTARGHRLRIGGAYDPDSLARLIRGLSG